MPVQDIHAHTFAKSSLLSSYQMPRVIPPIAVIRVLKKARISFVLVGAYGLAGWRKESRGTEDVDVVVAARHVKKAVRVLLAAFPELEAVDLPVVVRLRWQGTEDVVVDVMKPVQQPYMEVFKNTHAVVSEGEKYRVPSLEMAMVMKFAAMTSINRAKADKFRDAHDFSLLVEKNPDFDRSKVEELACTMDREGGKDILEVIRKIQLGEQLGL